MPNARLPKGSQCDVLYCTRDEVRNDRNEDEDGNVGPANKNVGRALLGIDDRESMSLQQAILKQAPIDDHSESICDTATNDSMKPKELESYCPTFRK